MPNQVKHDATGWLPLLTGRPPKKRYDMLGESKTISRTAIALTGHVDSPNIVVDLDDDRPLASQYTFARERRFWTLPFHAVGYGMLSIASI
ncbi:hypothetical protein GQ602_006107 [Ophiocordyceps camponoti-floridani]|uniref:Uncharacterized protein n=1 Tax=Ophiocordyceps camponoti-floridani TaxID=2030778 RepID=A0A8H4Q2N8_9HYPO|nr:hypothetical protein GQ602_006107 [Ophiocordyceps camponoti-floridani]